MLNFTIKCIHWTSHIKEKIYVIIGSKDFQFVVLFQRFIPPKKYRIRPDRPAKNKTNNLKIN